MTKYKLYVICLFALSKKEEIMKIRANPEKTRLFQIMFLSPLNIVYNNLSEMLEYNKIEYFVMVRNNFEAEQDKLTNYTLLSLGDICIGYRDNNLNQTYVAKPIVMAAQYGTMLDINGFKIIVRKTKLLDIPDFIHRVYLYTDEGIWTTYNNPIYTVGLSLDNIESININSGIIIDFFHNLAIEHLQECFAVA